MPFDLISLGDKISSVFNAIASFAYDIFFVTLETLIQRYIDQAESIPALQDILNNILDTLTTYFPAVSTATFFEFCCGTALLATMVISFVVWLVNVFK